MQLLKDYDRASDLKNKLANKNRIVVFNDAMRKRRVREIASKKPQSNKDSSFRKTT